MGRATAFVLLALGLALAGCEAEPDAIRVLATESFYLGLPDRVDPQPSSDAVDLTPFLEAPAAVLAAQSPDSLTVIASGGPVRITVELPPMPVHDVWGLRLLWRGTLGGELGISWRDANSRNFRRALGTVDVPGRAVEEFVELGFGPTRLLGPRMAEIGIDLPATEVGAITLARVELVVRPGSVLHNVSIDGELREVLAPGPERSLEWDLDVPADASVEFDYATHPIMRVSHGDGTRFVAEVIHEGRAVLLMDRWLSVFAVPGHRSWQRGQFDLSRWEGQRISLRLSTIAGPAESGIFPASAQTRDDDPLFSIPRIVSREDDRPNVLLIVIDTLRRDALGAWGGGPSPVLDALASRGFRFDRAWSTGSWTHPGTASLLSGWLPSRHGLGYGPAGTTRLDPSARMVTQDFREGGWATAAVTNNKIVSIEEGFAQGFAAFDQTTFEQDQVFGAQRVTRAAIRWLEQTSGGPFFLYLHYFDPHDRYQAPAPYTRVHVDPDADRAIKDSSVRSGKPNAFIPAMNPNARDLTDQELQYVRDLYRGEVSYVDAWIGNLFATLERQGRMRNTIVVVTSDHGEEFLEHGGLKHAHSLYEELISVPLIVHVPGQEAAGAVVERPVSLVDLPATIRALAGLPARIGDRSWPLATGEGAHPVLCENWHDGAGDRGGLQRSVIVWPHKLIQYSNGTAEFFDLERDPLEKLPLGDPPWGITLGALLDSIRGDDPAALPDAPVDPDLLEKLKAMGYVH